MNARQEVSENTPAVLAATPASRFDLRFPLLGIAVRVHPSFWLTAALFAWWSGDNIAMAVTGMACFFASVLIHELGHAGMLRRCRTRYHAEH